ncbi:MULTISPECIES: ABC transporter substrate-binding protein [Paracoccaceae]|jgi:iron complex transport system substrate-binding protein|uniref:ABC transporter substrate-binding protein n=1 Tax=Rhodobacterales TaxID=204455 RepID=UPI001B0CB672|nr:ABC transporter substrate-binding protein [Boseongicola sp. H5]MBO6922472.1 ABC transporter substrate-binding protein [Roseicyclus sp.]
MRGLLAILLLALPAHAQEMRPYIDDAGRTVEIPVAPQRIASLRGEQFTTPLWELGANLVASSGRQDGDKNGGDPYPRGAFDIFGIDFENTDLAFLGNPNAPDFEAIAAARPDLILIPDWREDDIDRLSAVAPTVVIGIWSNPLLERYRKIADAAGVLDVYEARLAQFETSLSDARAVVADTIPDPADVTITVADVFDRELVAYRDYAALSHVIRELGFATPPFILALEDSNARISPELLPEIDGDFLIGTYSIAFGQTPTSQRAQWEALVPVWDEVLHAPRHNQHFFLDRERMRGVSFAALETTLAILLSQVATRDFVPLGAD